MTKKKTQKKATTLTAEGAAKLVKKHKDDYELELAHITELDDGAAEALGAFKCNVLHLGQLPGAPGQLQRHLLGLAHRDGLKTISDKAAQALANFKGRLILKDSIEKKVEAAKKTAKAKRVVKKKPLAKKVVKKAAKSSLKDIVLEITRNKALTAEQITNVLHDIGYKLSGKNPVNSIRILLYINKKLFKDNKGKFTAA